VLAEIDLNVRELMRLQIGDTIPVDLPPQARLEVDGVSLNAGEYGNTQGWRALKVDRWLVRLPGPAAGPGRGLRPVVADPPPEKKQ